MRGELSPPRPTPSRPVGAEVVAVRAPKPVCVPGSPGIPAAAAVVLTNATLRPLTYKLRPELTAKATDYHLELVCGAKDESPVRALLVNDIDRNRVLLKGLTKEDGAGGDQVKLHALLSAPSRSEECVEQLVARLSLESKVTAVSWKQHVPPKLDQTLHAA